MKCHFFVFTLVLLLVNQVHAQTATCPENANDPKYQVLSQIVGSETITREYVLHIPKNYNPDTPTALIINMHGFGDCATSYAETIHDFYNFKELADEENIIVAYPQGAYRPEKEDTYWEPGDNGSDNIYESDVYFIEQLISDISTGYNVNPDMIYACGYSNGGMMAYSLACNKSSLFSAIGVMSGVMLEEDCNIENPVPIIKFHGIADGVLPYNGSIWYQSVDEVVGFWLTQNNIDNTSLESNQLNNGNVVYDQFSGGNDNSCIHLYTINEEYDKPGDHVWFSEEIEGLSPNEIMWNFFKNNCATLSSNVDLDHLSIDLFPNPVHDQIQIKGAMNATYQIFDLNGKIRLSGTIDANVDKINVASLEFGHYNIRIENQTARFLKVD